MEPVKLKLSTMMGVDSVAKSQRASGLKVRGFTSDCVICLPPTYTRDFIPLDRAHIPTPESAKRWKHLSSIADRIPPLIQCKVGLLIGYDCSRALAPRQVVTGGDYEPYAIKTDLGWSIVGGVPQYTNHGSITGSCHHLLAMELPPVASSAITAPDLDPPDTPRKERKGKKKTPQRHEFLQDFKESVLHNESGRIKMLLPDKAHSSLPDRKSALVCHKDLQIKLNSYSNGELGHDRVIKTVIKKGNEERVKSVDVCCSPGQDVNYPPKKLNKNKMVLDCNSEFLRWERGDPTKCSKGIVNITDLTQDVQAGGVKGMLLQHKVLSKVVNAQESISRSDHMSMTKNVDFDHD